MSCLDGTFLYHTINKNPLYVLLPALSLRLKLFLWCQRVKLFLSLSEQIISTFNSVKMGRQDIVLCSAYLLCLWSCAWGLLTTKGVNVEGNWISFSLKISKYYKSIIYFYAVEIGGEILIKLFLFVDAFWIFTVQALMGIKHSLTDPHNALSNWDDTSVDPCNWAMVTCSSDGFVINL